MDACGGCFVEFVGCVAWGVCSVLHRLCCVMCKVVFVHGVSAVGFVPQLELTESCRSKLSGSPVLVQPCPLVTMGSYGNDIIQTCTEQLGQSRKP